jgi:hypothetical protein
MLNVNERFGACMTEIAKIAYRRMLQAEPLPYDWKTGTPETFNCLNIKNSFGCIIWSNGVPCLKPAALLDSFRKYRRPVSIIDEIGEVHPEVGVAAGPPVAVLPDEPYLGIGITRTSATPGRRFTRMPRA